MKKLDLDAIKEKRQKEEKESGVLGFPIHMEGLADVQKSIDELAEVLNGKGEYDFNELKSQLVLVNKHLDLSPYFSNLQKALEANKPKDSVKATIVDFNTLIEAVKENKPLETKVDFGELKKAVVEVREAIEKKTEASDQGAENYQPVRRVVKAGNRFLFDDNMTSGGASGGGGVPTIDASGITAVPVVNPDGTPIAGSKGTTVTTSSVAGSDSSVTLLAANTSRLGATISNDSTAVLYVKLGATASTSSYNVKLFTDDYYEVPYDYVGIIAGIWASATGNARIGEVT